VVSLVGSKGAVTLIVGFERGRDIATVIPLARVSEDLVLATTLL